MTLSCNSGGIPLQYCRFISPNGYGYHLGNRQTSERLVKIKIFTWEFLIPFFVRISYYGKGIEYGECGISISNIQPSEAGDWKCVTKFFNEVDAENYEKEIVGNIFLDLIVPPQSNGNSSNRWISCVAPSDYARHPKNVIIWARMRSSTTKIVVYTRVGSNIPVTFGFADSAPPTRRRRLSYATSAWLAPKPI